MSRALSALLLVALLFVTPFAGLAEGRVPSEVGAAAPPPAPDAACGAHGALAPACAQANETGRALGRNVETAQALAEDFQEAPVETACSFHPPTCIAGDAAADPLGAACGPTARAACAAMNETLRDPTGGGADVLGAGCGAAPAGDACGTANATAQGAAEPARGANPVRIQSPATPGGARGDALVSIVWKAEVADLANTGALFRVAVKAQDAGAWTPVAGYRCYQAIEDDFPTGTCVAAWTPEGPGAYAIRVSALGTSQDDAVCQLGVTCDLATPFFVDDVPPVAQPPCVVTKGACLPTGAPATSVAVQAGANATDDRALRALTFTAVSPLGSVSCAVDAALLTSVNATRACALDLHALVPEVLPGVFVGDVSLRVDAEDQAGNLGSASRVLRVDTAPSPTVAVTPLSAAPAYAANGTNVTLEWRMTWASPASQAGQPAVNVEYVVARNGVAACVGKTSATGVFACTFTGSNAVVAIAAGVAPGANATGAGWSGAVTFTGVQLQRDATLDRPRATQTANVNETYHAGYRATFAHDGSGVPGAIVSLAANGFSTSFEVADAAGAVLVPQTSTMARQATFTSRAAFSPLPAAAGPGVLLRWTAIVPGTVAADDAFVSVGQTVTFTAAATDERTGVPIDAAGLGQGPGWPEGCAMLSGQVANGVLSVQARCLNATAAPLEIVVTTPTSAGVSTLRPRLHVAATWTSIDLQLLPRAAMGDAGAPIAVEGAALFTHDGSLVPSATLALGPGAPDGCSLEGGVVSGAVRANVTCAGVVSGAIPVVVASATGGATTLARPASFNATWTRIQVANLTVDDALVGAGSSVVVRANLTYVEPAGRKVWSAQVALGPGAPEGCSASGAVANGSLVASVSCASVRDLAAAGLPLALANATEGVTALETELRAKAVWTSLNVTGVAFDRAAANVDDTITMTASVAYAHDGAPVPTASVALPALPAACRMVSGGVQSGALRVAVACNATTEADFSVVVRNATGGIDALDAPAPRFARAWTRIVLSGLSVSDGLVNVGDLVWLNGTAAYVHNGTPVPQATLALLPGAPAGCVLESGAIASGAFSAAVRCDQVTNATLGLRVASATDGVVNATVPATLRAIWTKVNVSYTRAVTRTTLQPDQAVLVTANLTYAHDGSPVVDGVVAVQGRGGPSSFVCITGGGDNGPIPGVCSVQVTGALGKQTFDVTAFSTTLDAASGLLSPDVVALNATVPSFTHRWTAIAFQPFQCKVGSGPLGPCSGTYPKGTAVTVVATAVAADDSTEKLAGATIRLGGAQRTTDADGAASRVVTGFSSVSVTASGDAAALEGETVTWTLARTETIRFA